MVIQVKGIVSADIASAVSELLTLAQSRRSAVDEKCVFTQHFRMRCGR